ncbi:2,3-diaminopropionate biosynthesis protein SbnA [Olivibacter sp. SDN3]|uniref:2,3-diaminopropionate biosynthesis protein SbnA n=1 Tax=Olivibacter sp. SDN3 TaxID=2764720 RepID=UPI001651A129|nr:2,3-diaminopropionate biosynthesis protein SbnA [Olivibacter sp. SDN3]QNL51763.1 2,3-diaminopropionate biosynthesis protein SbnA [Olivibacter sp. SDN3]
MQKHHERPGILSVIGNTPLVRFSRLFFPWTFPFYGKMEMFNPGGSIKDRTAENIIDDALKQGLINTGSTIIESTSGNMGVGLAQLCLYHGLKLILVVDPHTNATVVQLLNTYGAKLVFVETHDGEGGYLNTRLLKVRELLAEIPGSFWPDQYHNPANPLAHQQTWREIIRDLGKAPDYLFVPTSTCGTLMGFANEIRQCGGKTKVVAVDAKGSVIFGDKPSKRQLPGIGSSRQSDFLDMAAIHGVIHVSDRDSVEGCRLLLQKESVLAGGSSGAVVHAISEMTHRFPPEIQVVGIFPDRGERYLDTIYSDDWVENNLGDLKHAEEVSV